MDGDITSLANIYKGWDDYQTSLVHAIAPLSPEQLAWRPVQRLRSVSEIAAHISLGRIGWFARMHAPGSRELSDQIDGTTEAAVAASRAELVRWLEASWKMVEDTLKAWTVADLAETYSQPFRGQTFAVSRQWTIWRVMEHDIHHGGQLAVMLGIQGIAIPELGDLGGHITLPPLTESS